ncbi:hypothetical protein M5689_001409 [Euphorbia peplus]|nr:hypothetical protein M5689_001409 [Euphorbia peplus]
MRNFSSNLNDSMVPKGGLILNGTGNQISTREQIHLAEEIYCSMKKHVTFLGIGEVDAATDSSSYGIAFQERIYGWVLILDKCTAFIGRLLDHIDEGWCKDIHQQGSHKG